MPIGTKSDFVIYEEQFQTGLNEGIEDWLNVFNAASGNTIVLESPESEMGDFRKEAQFLFADGFARRDPTTTSSVSAVKVTQGELVGPKCNWRDGPYDSTGDAFRKIGNNPDTMAFILGQQAAGKVLKHMISVAVASLRGVYSDATVAAGLTLDVSGGSDKTFSFRNANKVLQKFGDASQRIAAFFCHSLSFHQLVDDGLANYKVENVAGAFSVVGPESNALGRPIIFTDENYFFDVGTSASDDTTYNIYGLVPGAIRLKQTEVTDLIIDKISGLENITYRYQSEGAFTITLRGVEYSGAANPALSALATDSNWAKVATSLKSLPGVCLTAGPDYAS